jgi:hypothetical protein
MYVRVSVGGKFAKTLCVPNDRIEDLLKGVKVVL